MDEQGGEGLSPRMIALVADAAGNGLSSTAGLRLSTRNLFVVRRRTKTLAG